MARKAAHRKTDESTREKILGAAWSLFQSNATSDFTLAELAQRTGLHYTVLYHYFRNKSDLKAEIIERHSAGRSERLQQIRAGAGSGFDKLVSFIHAEMDQLPTNLLARQYDLFAEPYRSRVTSAFAGNVHEITRLIRDGIGDGSIRSCHPDVVARVILRILNRFANQNENVLSQAGLSSRDLAREIALFIGRGILRPGLTEDALPDAPYGPFPVPQTSDSNLDLMLRSLTGALNERGYDSTSIPDVAASIGLSKTSFYRFAASKEELLCLAAHRTLALNAQVRQVSRVVGKDPLDTLLHVMFYSRCLLDRLPGPTMHPAMFHFLANEHARAVWDIFTAGRFDVIEILNQGVAQGMFRKVDTTAVQPMLTALMNVPLRQPERGNPQFVDEVSHLMLYGIAGDD